MSVLHLFFQLGVHSIELRLESLLQLWSLHLEGGCRQPILDCECLRMQMYCCNLQCTILLIKQLTKTSLLLLQHVSTPRVLANICITEQLTSPCWLQTRHSLHRIDSCKLSEACLSPWQQLQHCSEQQCNSTRRSYCKKHEAIYSIMLLV